MSFSVVFRGAVSALFAAGAFFLLPSAQAQTPEDVRRAAEQERAAREREDQRRPLLELYPQAGMRLGISDLYALAHAAPGWPKQPPSA